MRQDSIHMELKLLLSQCESFCLGNVPFQNRTCVGYIESFT